MRNSSLKISSSERGKGSPIYRKSEDGKVRDQKGNDHGRDLQMRGRDLETQSCWPSGLRRSRTDFAVAICESRPQSSSQSECTMAVIRPGKLIVSPRLLLHEFCVLSLTIRFRDLGLPGRDLGLSGRDLRLVFVVHDLGRYLYF
ncbi:unnamed protein product [Linum trigynum]|uniref:Uncharacterized protein n=1 Tax=Linum trigynum TaxID=586398 RepID=A0AAV2ETS7_9ROSI